MTGSFSSCFRSRTTFCRGRITSWDGLRLGDRLFAPKGMLVFNVFCKDAFCSTMRLACARASVSFVVGGGQANSGSFTEVEVGGVCPDGYYMAGLACKVGVPKCGKLVLLCRTLSKKH